MDSGTSSHVSSIYMYMYMYMCVDYSGPIWTPLGQKCVCVISEVSWF